MYEDNESKFFHKSPESGGKNERFMRRGKRKLSLPETSMIDDTKQHGKASSFNSAKNSLLYRVVIPPVRRWVLIKVSEGDELYNEDLMPCALVSN